MKSKLVTAKDLMNLIHEATSRYAISVSSNDYKSYVNKLSDAVKIVKAAPDNSRVVITDKNRKDAKIVFGPKKTALQILVKICNKNPYS